MACLYVYQKPDTDFKIKILLFPILIGLAGIIIPHRIKNGSNIRSNVGLVSPHMLKCINIECIIEEN